MDSSTVTYLNSLNLEFYRITAPHFNATRQHPWAGWQRLLPHLSSPLRVLDLGCGNARFAHFLHDTCPEIELHYTGLDSDATLLDYAHQSLAATSLDYTLIEQDIVHSRLPDATYDLVVLFGVVHHIPGLVRRREFLAQTAQRVAPGGLLVFACWRFLEIESLRNRIVPWPEGYMREQGDYLLDWRRGERALRYCHHIDDVEHQRLVDATGLRLLDDFRADGRTNSLNRYSLLQR